MHRGMSAVLAAAAAAGLAALGLLAGCSVDSAETVGREVGIDVSGVYRHPDPNSRLVDRTSGQPVTQMNLRQSGDRLEGVDDNGILFVGTIGQVTGGTQASFTLEGRATSGMSATIAGTIAVADATSIMRGTWIEPNLFSTVYGSATVPTNAPPPVATNDVVRLNQSLVTISGTNGVAQFTASGSSGDFTWSLANSSIGAITAITGTRNANAAYRAAGAGQNTITARAAGGGSASARIVQE